MELALGTAQIGLAYGVNNAVGCLSDEEAAAVLAAAADSGFTMVDTSIEYGLAISRISEFLKKRPGAFEVMARNDVGRVSIYTPEEAEAVRDGCTAIQFPANMLDGRMDGEIRKQQDRGRTVIVRSLLLQGLLMASPEAGPIGHHRAPELADAARPYLQGIREIAIAHGVTVLEMAVRWVWYLMPNIAVIGAETPEQVREIARAWRRGPLPEPLIDKILALREDIPELVISPRMWNQQYDFTGQA